MPKWRYVARNREGKKIRGEFVGPSINALYEFIDQSGLLLIELPEQVVETKRKSKFALFSRVDRKYIISALEVFVTLLEAGFRISDALEDVAGADIHPRLSEVILSVKEKIDGGMTLADAMADFPEVFDESLVEAVRVGETTGKLDKVLKGQIDRMKYEENIKALIKKQSIYPVFMLFMMAGLIVLATKFFLPRLMNSYKEVLPTTELPPKAAFFIHMNEKLTVIGPFVGLAIIAIIIIWFLMGKHKRTKEIKDAIIMKTPILKKITMYVELARAAQVLALGISSGITISECLSAIQRGARNEVFRKIMGQIRTSFERGATLAQVITPQNTDYLFAALVRAGELSGKIPETMEQASEHYVKAARNMVGTFMEIVSYLILLVLGLLVTYIILSVIVPMYELPQMLTK